MATKLERVQQKLTDLLQVFHDFCEENNIKYYIAYGTLIGAVRHKGFIPWDDDVDVVVSRDDYNKIVKLFKEGKFPENSYLKYGETSKDFLFPYAMFLDKNTTLIYKREGSGIDMVEGLYIDIFPLDGAGNNMLQAMYHNRKAFFKAKLLAYSQEKYEGSRKLFQILSNYAQKQDPRKLYDSIEHFIRKKDGNKSKYIAFLPSAPSTDGIFTHEILGERKLYPFGDKMFYGPEDADKFLTLVYGDYMTLPPEDKRQQHSYRYINFNLSFEEYERLVKEGKEIPEEDF